MDVKTFIDTFLKVDSTTTLLNDKKYNIYSQINTYLESNPNDESAEFTTLRVFKFDAGIIAYNKDMTKQMHEYFTDNPPKIFQNKRIEGLYNLAQGIYCRQQNSFDESTTFFNKAVECFKECGDHNELYRTHVNMLRQYSYYDLNEEKAEKEVEEIALHSPRVTTTYYKMFANNVRASWLERQGDGVKANEMQELAGTFSYKALVTVTPYNQPMPISIVDVDGLPSEYKKACLKNS